MPPRPDFFCKLKVTKHVFLILLSLSVLQGYRTLKNLHRIDKNTSGVCILVKNEIDKTSREMFYGPNGSTMKAKKCYIALVDGEFPGTVVIHSVL